MLLRCAYIASLCRVGVGFRLGQDLPFNGEALFFAFKLPDVLAKFRVVLARFVVERHLMVSEPSFELRGCKTNNNNNNNNIYFYSANSTVQFSNALYNVKIIG